MSSLAGKLLVATPLLVDPHFWRSVVLLLQHDDDEGALGVVLNRPTMEKVADHLGDWAAFVPEPGLVHFGGPVEPAVAIALSTGSQGESTALPGVRLADVSVGTGSFTGAVRVYSGYSGWGPGQLEGEIEEGSWYVVDAAPDDPFDEPDGQWARVLRRQGGHLALVASLPIDTSLN